MSGTPTDINFDDRADRFGERIHGSFKGRLRIELAWQDLCAALPALEQSQGLSCIDVGAGQGQFAQRLLAHGHEVLLCDISARMLAIAREQLTGLALNGKPPRFRHGPLQSLADSEQAGGYQLVVCHAVLEWLAEPLAALPTLFDLMAPDGLLSLMFYNRHGLVLNDMIKGNYRKLLAQDFAGDPDGLTPPNPLPPQSVLAAVAECSGEVVSRRGVRCAWDVLRRPERERREFTDVLAVESEYGVQEPFWQLGRYVHLVLRKAR